MSQDLLPGTISSDLHKYNIDGPVYSLALTMSKFLHLGLSLEEVIRKVTSAPAAAMGMLDEIGVIREGTCADLTLFRIIVDAVELCDAIGGTRTGERSIEHVSTVRGGRLYAPGVFD